MGFPPKFYYSNPCTSRSVPTVFKKAMKFPVDTGARSSHAETVTEIGAHNFDSRRKSLNTPVDVGVD
jgi:hypothetical protein